MTSSGRRRLGWAVALAVVGAAALPVWGQAEPEVYFLEPQPGAVVEGPPWVTVTGRARGPKLEPARGFDVMLILDTSGSTAKSASGLLDWRARGGFSGRSILAAEVTAALNFLGQADASTTRIGLITFAGYYQPMTGRAVEGRSNAWVLQPLTVNYDSVRAALQQVLRRGPDGGTDMAAGLRLATRELLALHGADSSSRPDARKVALLLTDGYPTLPFGLVSDQDLGNVEVTLSAARAGAKDGILVHTFCLGAEALQKPVACQEIARLTGGRAQLLETPADVVDLLPRTPLGNIELVSVRNATTGQLARSLAVTPDGTFTAEVSLAPGENRLVVDLHGGVGVRRSAALVIRYGQPDVNAQADRATPRSQELQIQIQIERPATSAR
jgi:Mg-chelatase subunit ChlD